MEQNGFNLVFVLEHLKVTVSMFIGPIQVRVVGFYFLAVSNQTYLKFNYDL